jgi:small conductance mechanosensitive channel
MVRLLGSAVYYLILALAVGRSLIALGVSETFVTTVTLVALALIALALNQSIANFAATVVFLFFQPFRRGDWVETMGHFGVVQEILLFNTVILLPDRRLVSLPNSKIQESGVTNYSQMRSVLALFTLTVAYHEDLARVRGLITEIAAQDARILPDPPFDVVVDVLGETGVRLLVLPAVRPEDYLAVRNDLRARIKARFDAEGTAFAVPRREVRIAADAPSPESLDRRAPPRRRDRAGAG